VRVTPALIDDLVRAAASEVLIARGLDPAALPADPEIGRPRDRAQGEYATPLALRAAARVGVAPRELAGWVAEALVARPEVAGADVAGPGFLNLRMTPAGRAAVVAEALTGDVDGAAVRAAAVRLAADLPEELVGVEGARYALLRSSTGTIGDTGMLARRVPENPLFRVQYAHARLVALSANAADLGVTSGPDPGILVAPAEIDLVGRIAEYPAAARSGEPHRLARHLEALADAVLDVASGPVLPRGDEEVTDLHRARLAMVVAARRLLANGLGLLGVSAPERI
jgi:arginyl-tRNA synthetase